MDQHGGEIFRDRRAVCPCPLAQLDERHKAHRHMEGVKRLGRTGVRIGLGHSAQSERVPSRVAGVGVLHLLRTRRLVKIQHTVPDRDRHAGLAQILRQQRAEKGHGSSSVGEGMEHLDGDAVAVIVKAHEPAVVLPEADGLTGIGNVLLQKGPGCAVRFEIIPEEAPADAHGKARKARHTAVDRALERVGPHRLGHPRGEAVDGGVFLFLQRGI